MGAILNHPTLVMLLALVLQWLAAYPSDPLRRRSWLVTDAVVGEWCLKSACSRCPSRCRNGAKVGDPTATLVDGPGQLTGEDARSDVARPVHCL